jgi:polysaccharide deacetylase family protein (PEP-CTERM system associated)
MAAACPEMLIQTFVEGSPVLNALTIDVEDYYHVSAFERVVRYEDWDLYESRVKRNTDRILDLLDEHQTKATFFVLGWVAEQQPKSIRAISERGHEVASHGYAHRRIYTQTPDQFREETRRSKRIIEDIIGRPVIGYRAASYSVTRKSLWALDILSEEGFRYDSSIFPIFRDRYGIPGYPRFPHRVKVNGGHLMEYPLSTVRVGGINIPIAGGGYLRLFPYAFTRWGLRWINEQEKQPAIVYLHPWEIDPDQPRMDGNLLSNFRHYVNLDGTEEKFISLLREFKFESLRTLCDQWDEKMEGINL